MPIMTVVKYCSWH